MYSGFVVSKLLQCLCSAETGPKRNWPEDIGGLTIAADLWLTAAMGSATGMGCELSTVLGTVLAFIILSLQPQGRQTYAIRSCNWAHAL